MKYTMTRDTITILDDGKPVSVAKGAPNWIALRDALLIAAAVDTPESWEEVRKHLTIRTSLAAWAKGNFTLSKDDVLSYWGEPIPEAINKRISGMAARGEDPAPLFKFYERLQLNPSMRSVEQLFPFLDHKGIPLTAEGRFLAYKGVNSDYKDKHSGQWDNTPGVVNEMPRNKISDDPNHACHEGFHVGALEYAQSFASRVVICEVDPQDVVCVPYDVSQQKMRVCRYKVIGNHNGEYLSSTTHEVEKKPVIVVGTIKKKAKKDNKKSRRRYQAMDKMKMIDLLKQSIEDLRGYAGGWCKIIGASKIPGGKTALVSQILKVRKKAK